MNDKIQIPFKPLSFYTYIGLKSGHALIQWKVIYIYFFSPVRVSKDQKTVQLVQGENSIGIEKQTIYNVRYWQRINNYNNCRRRISRLYTSRCYNELKGFSVIRYHFYADQYLFFIRPYICRRKCPLANNF